MSNKKEVWRLKENPGEVKRPSLINVADKYLKPALVSREEMSEWHREYQGQWGTPEALSTYEQLEEASRRIQAHTLPAMTRENQAELIRAINEGRTQSFSMDEVSELPRGHIGHGYIQPLREQVVTYGSLIQRGMRDTDNNRIEMRGDFDGD